jgi:chaperone required for assembly of F1-ATPase
LLDDKPVRTPAKAQVVLPIKAMAREVASEWEAQEKVVSPLTMPMTRTAATCLDRVAPELDAMRATIAAYGETDLLCYRAEHPQALVDRQSYSWDPMLRWAGDALAARLKVATGVMHVAQDAEAISALTQAVCQHDAWALTSLADLTTISGSLVLALAVSQGHVTAARAWELSRIDEDWNIEQWGEDQEAAELAARKQADFLHAARVLEILRHG